MDVHTAAPATPASTAPRAQRCACVPAQFSVVLVPPGAAKLHLVLVLLAWRPPARTRERLHRPAWRRGCPSALSLPCALTMVRVRAKASGEVRVGWASLLCLFSRSVCLQPRWMLSAYASNNATWDTAYCKVSVK